VLGAEGESAGGEQRRRRSSAVVHDLGEASCGLELIVIMVLLGARDSTRRKRIVGHERQREAGVPGRREECVEWLGWGLTRQRDANRGDGTLEGRAC
jgi:hypothetical protein